MAGALLPIAKQQFFDDDGSPLAGGSLHTYEPGTTDNKATYSDADLVTPNANPVSLNARGEAVIYGTGTYRMILKRANGTVVWDRDNVGVGDVSSALVNGRSLESIFKSSVGQVVTTIAALKALTKSKYTQAFVSGYYAEGDGGGGPYYLDADDTSSADNGGTVIVAADGGRWKLLTAGQISAAQFGVLPGTKSADERATRLEALRLYAEKSSAKVFIPPGTYTLPPQVRLDADNTEWDFALGAVLKLYDTAATNDFIVFASPVNQRVRGLRVDGNRAIQTSFHADDAACIVVDAQSCVFENTEVIGSAGKGFALVSAVGNTTRDIEIRGFKGADCKEQVLIVDGNNRAGFFERIVISGVRIGATSHAGLTLNDGAQYVAVSDVISDVQNSVADAVSIRDSYDIQLSNVRGRRGRNGIGIERLNGFCGRIQLDNVVGESNNQSGVLLLGAEAITGGAVTGRSNADAGINIAAISGHKCRDVTIASPCAYDDRGTPAQQYGILVQGVNGCRLGKYSAYNNTVKNITVIRSETSSVDVDIRQIATGSTGSVAASSEAVVALTWPTAFEDASIDIESITVSVGTSSRSLCVSHVIALTATVIQVMVVNLNGTTAQTGTLTVIGRRTM